MPPSGFSEYAAEQLCAGIRNIYAKIMRDYDISAATEERELRRAIVDLEQRTKSAITAVYGLSEEEAQPWANFMLDNFQALIREIHEGKKARGRSVQQEIEDLDRFLAPLKEQVEAFTIHDGMRG